MAKAGDPLQPRIVVDRRHVVPKTVAWSLFGQAFYKSAVDLIFGKSQRLRVDVLKNVVPDAPQLPVIRSQVVNDSPLRIAVDSNARWHRELERTTLVISGTVECELY